MRWRRRTECDDAPISIAILRGRFSSDKAVIQVVSRAFDVLRCFDGPEQRLGNLEISLRCGLPRSTVSRLTQTLTRLGQLVYLPRDQKYQLGPAPWR